MNRRDFLKTTCIGMGCLATSSGRPLLGGEPRASAESAAATGSSKPGLPFGISLAEWSLHNTLRKGQLEHLDFPRHAREAFGIDAVEYVDQFFADRVSDRAYLSELKKRAEGEGVRAWVLMVDTAGPLGAADAQARAKAVERHKAWMDAARYLGCGVLRVNARGDGSGDGSPEELARRMAESGALLAAYGKELDLNVVIENHGGPSSDPEWLAGVIHRVDSPWFGTLPDFGNFPDSVDRYAAVEKLMPSAKAVSAKSGRFDEAGDELGTDFPRMMDIVLDAGYRGLVGIEVGVRSVEEEAAGIRKTRALLEKIRDRIPPLEPIFNGRDLTGWRKVAGGDWTVESGVLVARNGRDWSTDPARTGSWLRTEKEYSDFELLVEYTVEPRSNSGVFIRSALEGNPAFTGYEVQIHDSPGRPPSKGGPGSLYDYAAPAKNRVRPAGEWNRIRVIAKGPGIRVHLNGEMVVDTKGNRRPKGYIGLQNHDERSVARFRHVLLREL